MLPAGLPLAASPAADTLDIEVSAATWAGLAVLVTAMLALDLRVFARGDAPRLRESAAWSVVWLVVALAFGVGWWWWQGSESGSQYLAGYLLERSLSLDNVFVFAVILSYFAVPEPVQPKLLSWGIALALVLRLAFILAGAALLDAFHITFYLFGLLLLYTAYRLARHEGQEIDPEHNPALRLIRRRVPMTESYDHGRFVTRHAGRRIATPLLAVFVVVATTDVIFAVDSIPAIFAVTREPFVVFAANMRILVGVDGSPRSDDALALAVLLSRALDAELLLSRVHPPKRLRPPLRTRKPHRPINRAADTALRTPRVHPQVRSELQVSMLADTLRQSTSGD